MSHLCPGPGCQRTVDDDKLMCLAHWNRVPADLRRDVYAAWRRGQGAGTPEHRKAMMAAIGSVGGQP